MSFNPANLFWSFLFGAVGLAYFRYGKKQAEIPLIAAGLGLMIYPYFFESLGWLIGVGVALSAAPWIILRGL